MPSEHARLQPSSAKRWLTCPGSVELCSNVVEDDSAYADEGTAGHAVFEAMLLGEKPPERVNVARDGEPERWIEITTELRALVDTAYEWVREYVDGVGNVAIFSEQRYEVGAGFGLKPGLFWGTADFTALSSVELAVGDLKLGFVAVPIEHIDEQGKRHPNEQLASYALGALDATGWMHDQVRLMIWQPKVSDAPKVAVFTAAELAAWRDENRAAVHRAAEGGPLVPSDEGCRFCKAAGACPRLKEEMLAMARREFSNVLTLSGEEISDLLKKGELIENALKSIRSHAMKLLEMDPAAVPGWKRVMGDTKRRWKSEDAAARKLEEEAIDPYEKVVISPAQAEEKLADDLWNAAKAAGSKITKKAAKEKAKEITAPLTEKPLGQPTLVPDDDARQALEAVFTVEEVKALEAADEGLLS